MTDAERRLHKAGDSLVFARHALAGGFAAEAGRAAYMAAYHAAQALSLSRTGRAPKTHSGARSEFTRLAHHEPALTRSFSAFLGRAYELKAFADYDQAKPVTVLGAEAAISEAARFVEAIAALIASSTSISVTVGDQSTISGANMRILVVGAGSTGGYFGGRLAQTGRDVTFLVRPARAAQIRTNGRKIVSPHGDVTLAPTLVTAPDITGPYDAVLLTVKGYALDAALADITPAVGPDTMILPVLNGMKHMDILADRFGARTVVGCACKVAAFVDDAGRIVQLARFQELVYGEMDGTATPRMQRLDETLQGAGFTARLSPTVAQEMWEKWTLLATMGGICCLMRGNTGEIASAPGGAEFSANFLDEVVRIVSTVGVAPREAFVNATRTALADSKSQQTTSMYRDLTQGRPVEAEQIIGDLLARGQADGIETPLLAAAFAHLSIYQARLAA